MRGLGLDAEQRALADTVRRFCEDSFKGDGEVVRRDFDRALWERLAELGVLTLATEEGGGGAVHVVAVMTQLGRAGFAGPLAGTVVAAQLLPPAERESVTSGRALVALAGGSPRVPWAPVADIFIQLARDGFAYRAVPASEITPLATMSGEPWGEVELDASDRLGACERPVALGDVALAAYLAGSAGEVVAIAAEYVKHRRQFGRSLGEFQAVAHPLADCHARAVAARDIALYAAHHLDAGTPGAAALAAAARLSATDAATRAAYAGHQAMGGMGFVEGTLLSVLTRAARTLSLAPPGLESTRLTASGRAPAPARA
jgi:alkylation response protein AidB-like acyl-CoA dehydrogenase